MNTKLPKLTREEWASFWLIRHEFFDRHLNTNYIKIPLRRQIALGLLSLATNKVLGNGYKKDDSSARTHYSKASIYDPESITYRPELRKALGLKYNFPRSPTQRTK